MAFLEVQQTCVPLLSVLFVVMATQVVQTTNQHLSDVAGASNEFAFHLYQTLQTQAITKGQNIFCSPISITTALAMTYIGARGETANQMKLVLRFNRVQENQLHQSLRDLNDLLNKQDSYTILKSANRLFGHKGYGLLNEFVDQTKMYYKTTLERYDFVGNPVAAATDINSWVEDQTNGKIKDVINDIDPLTRLILVNAIYFKGMWLNQFDTNNTQNSIFHISQYEKADVEMMFQKKRFNMTYDSTSKCMILELPYKGNDLSMLIILPDEIEGLAKLEAKLSARLLNSWTSKFHSEKVELSLPKFKFTQDFLLNDALVTMGMNDLFSEEKADLSGISGTRDLYVSKVIHKAFIEVNEEGSEAAASTVVVVSKRSIEHNTRFRADHPFVFVIRDKRTGVILFMGRMMNPGLVNGRDEL